MRRELAACLFTCFLSACAVASPAQLASPSKPGTEVAAVPKPTKATDTNPEQVAAWEAAIVGTIVGTMLTVLNLILGIVRQRREDKRKRAETGYKLTDDMFTDKGVIDLLYAIDATAQPTERRTAHAKMLAADFYNYFRRGKENMPPERVSDLVSRVDDLIFHLDRMEHAIQSRITDFNSVEMPIGYYIRALAKCKERLLPYITDVGYARVPAFLDRYEAWRKGEDVRPDPP